MKKTNKAPDGTEEVLEGNPDEILEYERRNAERESGIPAQQPVNESPKKPGILHGAEVDGKPLTDAEIELIRYTRKVELPVGTKRDPFGKQDWMPRYPNPIWITYCTTCYKVDCHGECWSQFRAPWYTITYQTRSGTSLKMRDDGTFEPLSLAAAVLSPLQVKTNGN